jgi:hypothetical protein
VNLSIGKLLKIASISATKQFSKKRKINSLENKNSHRKPNWPGMLLGRAWETGPRPAPPPAARWRSPGRHMRSDGPALKSPDQNRRDRVGWNPSSFLPFSPSPLLPQTRAATEEEKKRTMAATGADHRVEGNGTVASPFAGARVPLSGERAAVEWPGCDALDPVWGRLPGSSGKWRPTWSRLPSLPLSPLSDFFSSRSIPVNLGLGFFKNSSPILICSWFKIFSAWSTTTPSRSTT